MSAEKDRCSKCGRVLVPVYVGMSHEFLIGGYCRKCKKFYPLMEADRVG